MIRSLAARSGDFFKINDLVKVEKLLESRVHFGHKQDMLNPYMRPYIFGKRLDILIIDLDKTANLLRKALNVSAEIAYRKGIILFTHQSRQNGHIVEKAAKECGEYAQCRRWEDRFFTNAEKTYSTVTRLPDLVLLFSAVEMGNQPHRAIKMSNRMLIPTIGICDTNCDPRLVTYPVPGNDDTPASIQHYCDLFKAAIMNGKSKRKEIIEKQGEDFYYKSLEFEEDQKEEEKVNS